MRRGWRRWLDDWFLAGLGLAVLLFAGWQVFNHYFFMEYLMARLHMTMLFYHYLSFMGEMLFAAVIVLFASHALIVKNRQLETLSRQKDLLTHALVHDLRQPLTAVIGGLSSTAAAPDLPAGTREMVEIAHQGAHQLLGMVNDLLDIGRLEAGKPLSGLEATGLAEIVRDGVGLVAEISRAYRQELTLDLPEHPPLVNGDAKRLARVVTNIVGNAIKFTPAGGQIRVSVHTDDAGARALVSVSDTGPGIPKEFQRTIFDRFASLEMDPSRGRVCTGLGLTFCKMMVEAHGGRIWVESEPGQGSTFTFSLPILVSLPTHRVVGAA